MITTNLTIVTQLPIVESQLREAGAKVDAKVQEAMSLVCTEETVKAIKEVRASLNKELKAFEDKRKEIKTEIMVPYEKFDATYKEHIADKYKMAVEKLGEKIDSVENELKDEKKSQLEKHFNEYAKVKEIEFVTFEQAKINVTLSASMKSLKEQVENFLDRIESEIMIIQTQQYKDEIMYEYKKTLDISYAIKTVTERKQAIQYETQKEQIEAEKVTKGTTIDKAWMDEPLKPSMSDFVMRAPMKIAVFKVNAPSTQLKGVMDFMNQLNIKYEVEIYEHI